MSLPSLSMPSRSAAAVCCRLCHHTHHLVVPPAAVLPEDVHLLQTPHLPPPPHLPPLSHHLPPLLHPENHYATLLPQLLNTADMCNDVNRIKASYDLLMPKNTMN